MPAISKTVEPTQITLADGNARPPQRNYSEDNYTTTNKQVDNSPTKDFIELDNNKVLSDLNKINSTSNTGGIKGGSGSGSGNGSWSANQSYQEPQTNETIQTTNTNTEYSWDKNAKQKANTQYLLDANQAKQNALENANTIKQNMTQYQEQADMMQYQNNQSAEKVGWTGGYILDQNRQMNYLKASLAAQMYGAVELQKYGYDTSLAAARLSYDLNQQEYARQYYQDAVNNALNEAQVTGTYFSPEIKDMLNQLSIAEETLKADGYTYDEASGEYLDANGNPADTKDSKLYNQIKSWFGENQITDTGIRTIAAIQADRQQELQWRTQTWQEYNAALLASQDKINDNTVFARYNSSGQMVYETTEVDGQTIPTKVETIDMSKMSDADLYKYAKSHPKAEEQVTAYLNWKAQDIINQNTKTDSNGITTENNTKIASELQQLQKQAKQTVGHELEIENYSTNEKGEGVYKGSSQNSQLSSDDLIKNKKEIDTELANIMQTNDSYKLLDLKVDNSKQTLSAYSKESAFGNYNGTGNTKDSQSKWVNIINGLAQKGKIPNGTMVDFNVGVGNKQNKPIYYFKDGYWYPINVADAFDSKALNSLSLVAHLNNYKDTWDNSILDLVGTWFGNDAVTYAQEYLDKVNYS